MRFNRSVLYLGDVVKRGDGEADWEHVAPPADRLQGEDDGVHALHVDADGHAHRAHSGKASVDLYREVQQDLHQILKYSV